MKKVFTFAFFVIIALIFVAVYIVINSTAKTLSEKEKENAITKILGRKPNLSDTAPQGNKVFKGKYVTFIYPAAAKIYAIRLNGQPVKQTNLENFIFDLDSPRRSYYMEVVAVPKTVQSVNDSPSVKLRQIEANIYTQSNISLGGLAGLSFEKKSNNGNELTAFFYKDGKVYSFSSQGNDIKAVRDLFDKIIATVKFL